MSLSKVNRAILGLSLLSIGFSTGYFFGSRQEIQISLSAPEISGIKKPGNTTAQPNPINDDFVRVYQRLGLLNGDTIYKINDVTTPDGFGVLVAAYDRGDVCVNYKRESQRRTVCMKRDDTGEHVTDETVN